jgi:hypothetical protein
MGFFPHDEIRWKSVSPLHLKRKGGDTMKTKRIFLITVLVLSLAVMAVGAATLIVPTSPGSTAAVTAASLTQIEQYQVMYSSNGFVPRIWLINETGYYFAQLIFEADGSTLPPDSSGGGSVNIYYHLEDFQNCIDLLRKESTVSLLWAGTGAGNENGLLTGAEPVGEGATLFSVVRGEDNGIYYHIFNQTTNAWNAWEKLPGATCDSPAAAIVGNQLRVVVRGMDGSSLWQGYIDVATDSFSGWTHISGATPSAPELASGYTTPP